MNLRHYTRCVVSIAKNTFKEAIRDRILHGIVFLAVMLVLLSMAFGQLSLENDARVIRDLGVSLMSLIVVVVAIFSGVSLLYSEVHRKTIYTIVTKPVPRWAFIVGKYLGLVLTLATVELVLGVVLLGIMGVRGDPVHTVMFQSLILILAEGVIVASIATLFSSFTTPFLAGLFTAGLFLLGRLRDQIYQYADAIEASVLPEIVRVVGVAVPDLTLHRGDLQVAYLVSLNWAYVGYTAMYSVLYAAILVILASLIFGRRDFG